MREDELTSRSQMMPGSLTSMFEDRAPPLEKTIELTNEIVGIGRGPFGTLQLLRQCAHD